MCPKINGNNDDDDEHSISSIPGNPVIYFRTNKFLPHYTLTLPQFLD